MLQSLSIKNFALIENLELHLNNQLTIITGETGAGKSILLGALSLLLGKRADLNSLKNPQKKCIIEGVFQIENYQLETLFKELDLDYDSQSIIRREILPSGKSRAFVNDTPVKLQQLSTLGKHLVDIHSQHETLFVGESDYQYKVIDALANNEEIVLKYQTSLKTYKDLQQALAALQQQQQEAQKTYDYHLFLLNELKESNLQVGMQEVLEEKYQQLANVEELKENLATTQQQLQQEDLGVIDALRVINNKLGKIADYGKAYLQLNERLNSVLLEVEDMATEIDQLLDKVEDDPEALETVNEKLQNLYALQQKHGLSTVEDLLNLQQELTEKVAVSLHADEKKAELETKIKTAANEVQQHGNELFTRRKKVVSQFKKAVETILKKVGMPNAQLKIEITSQHVFNAHGIDEMRWLFSANKGGTFQEIRKSASGGELSRITLAIKSILAQYSKLPTLIFDEIDTGVSGEVAQKMGTIMQKMGENLQIISITHLPQIAAKGEHHFKVYKEIEENSTQTHIKELSPQERIDELAEMLGGKNKSDSAIAHAKVLLQ